ncbi:MAG: glycosyltransferase [Oscillospiraceae bacterium]
MLLSIGMIVKNEEKYLEQCLTSLKPILENVDSELIIADTGSTDNTVEIAKKYTDKVYFFEWINDFAAARNYTMEKASGEWFMFLDADEVFQSCDEIIRFFNSGEYRAFGNASYTIRSYSDESNLSIFMDTVGVRLAKRYPDVAFRNKVHEGFSPLHNPVKMLHTIADHYGYFYKNAGKITNVAYEKSKRNLEILFESINNPPFDFSVYREIADCYNIIKDYDNALKYINIGLDTLSHDYIGITQYYSFKAVHLSQEKKYNEMIEVCNDYFSEKNTFRKNPIATDVDMYALRGEGFFYTKNYEKAAEDYIQFFKLYRDYKNGKLNTQDLLYNSLKVNDGIVKKIYMFFMISCIKLGKYNSAMEYLKGFPVDAVQSDKKYMIEHFRRRAEIMEHTGWKSAKKFIITLDDENKKLFFRTLRGKMFYTDKPEELLRVLSEFKNVVPEAEDAITIYCSLINEDLQYEQIKSFIEKYGANGNTDILLIMLNCGMDISCFIAADDLNSESCACEFFKAFPDKSNLLEVFDVFTLSPDVLAKAASLYGWAMACAINSGKDIAELFGAFGRIAVKWKSEFPNENNIPGDIRAGEYAYRIAEAREKRDYQTCIAEMRRLIKVCPSAAPLVSEYRKVIERETVQQRNVSAELAEMANAVKRNIRSMLDAGDVSSAEKTLLELEKLCPADSEIGMLKYKIKMLKKQ